MDNDAECGSEESRDSFGALMGQDMLEVVDVLVAESTVDD